MGGPHPSDQGSWLSRPGRRDKPDPPNSAFAPDVPVGEPASPEALSFGHANAERGR